MGETMADRIKRVRESLKSGEGIVRLAPTWVPRSFCIPGKRLKLHPDDYYAFGAHRGGIDERWFSSTTKADNGPETLEDEGLSYIVTGSGGDGNKVLLKEAMEEIGDEFLGQDVMTTHGGWTMYSKFFDNLEPLPHHLHHSDDKAALVGMRGKPEAYYFPRQLNNKRGYFPYTFFGLNPGVTPEQVRKTLENWHTGDNGILELSRAYKLTPGTGWDVPPGLLHAPGSFLTYEPQRASDVFAMFQSIVWDSYTPWDLLVKNVPADKKNDLDFIMSLIDWDLNVDPEMYRNRFSPPKPVADTEHMREKGYEELWITYKSEYFSAKELTVFPGRSVTITDDAAYGAIVIQGRGTFGNLQANSPSMIRFGEMTEDEFFVTAPAARNGIVVTNTSEYENLVMLKHFGPKA
jgi:hypothetical protein